MSSTSAVGSLPVAGGSVAMGFGPVAGASTSHVSSQSGGGLVMVTATRMSALSLAAISMRVATALGSSLPPRKASMVSGSSCRLAMRLPGSSRSRSWIMYCQHSDQATMRLLGVALTTGSTAMLW
ncbi:MAG: hypothetical protein HYU66_02105 [Armatimonadetes bacterium]|nr:hypothetical protein [Armatimonadota bacterium]